MAAFKVYFCTERDKHPPADCNLCSHIMALQYWTGGDIIKHIPEWPNTKPLRMRLRHHIGASEFEGVSIGQVLYAIGQEFPHLPPLSMDIFTPWPTLDKLTQAQTHVAVVLGNPSFVVNPLSPLRTVQHSDNYDHAILIVGKGVATKRLLDPLRDEPMTWTGMDVPDRDVVQFGSKFTRPGLGVECALFRIGAAAPSVPVPQPKDDVVLVRDWNAQLFQLKLKPHVTIENVKGDPITTAEKPGFTFPFIGVAPDDRYVIGIDTKVSGTLEHREGYVKKDNADGIPIPPPTTDNSALKARIVAKDAAFDKVTAAAAEGKKA